MADSLKPRLPLKEAAAAGALIFIVSVTAAWWALALWPVPGDVPPWLARTRAVCFGSAPNGLPAATGWLLLIGEPIAMLIALMIIAGEAVPSSLRFIAAYRPGRAALAGSGLVVLAGLAAAGVRVARASGPADATLTAPRDALTAERLAGAAPALDLVDQSGETVSLSRFRGRVVLVTFGYAHCETVCPIAVREVLLAQSSLAANRPLVVVVTLDPWRDTPARLASIAGRWKLTPEAFLLSGAIPDVERVLDAWNVARTRDTGTGEVTHATAVFVVDRDGRLAYRVSPFAEAIIELARGL